MHHFLTAAVEMVAKIYRSTLVTVIWLWNTKNRKKYNNISSSCGNKQLLEKKLELAAFDHVNLLKLEK